MSNPGFDPSIVTGFGTAGQETARKMFEAVSANSLSITYDPASKQFSVLGSSSLDKEVVEKIFAEKNMRGGLLKYLMRQMIQEIRLFAWWHLQMKKKFMRLRLELLVALGQGMMMLPS